MSMFTDRLRTDRNPFDNYDLREQAADRIGQLEAALRELLHKCNNEISPFADGCGDIARAALAPEQDK